MGISRGLSSVICWKDERVGDEGEVVNRRSRMTSTRRLHFLLWVSVPRKSMDGFGGPAFSPEGTGIVLRFLGQELAREEKKGSSYSFRPLITENDVRVNLAACMHPPTYPPIHPFIFDPSTCQSTHPPIHPSSTHLPI